MKVIYKIRQGLFSDGNKIFSEAPKNRKIKEVGEAPIGHASRLHNERLTRSQNIKRRANS